MSRLLQVLKQEPAALGTLVAAVAPVLVLAGIVHVDEKGISAIVLGVNALVGFAVRLLVTPTANVGVDSSAVPSGNAPAGGGA